MSDAAAAVAEAAQAPVVADTLAVAVEAPKEAETVAEDKTEETKEEEKKGEKKEEEKKGEKKEEGTKEEAANSKLEKKSKFDPSVLPESEDHAAIQTQVHFYFSDSNLPTDKYLWELTGGAENKPVELKKLCQFGRMRRFKSYETVVAALKESKFLVIRGEAGAETVARKTAYNPDRPRNKVDVATVYAKGFGEEQPTTQFDLEAFFSKFGTVNCVRLRRAADNLFKGSVFVEFQDADQAAAFLALDPAPQWEGQDLKLMSKAAYVAEKSQLIREGKIEPSNNSAPRFYEGRTFGGKRGGRGGGPHHHNNKNGHGAADKDDWKKRREDDRKRGGFRNGGGRGNFRGRGGGRGGYNNHRNGQNGKRSRDDDSASEPPAKKADTKVEAAVTTAA